MTLATSWKKKLELGEPEIPYSPNFVAENGDLRPKSHILGTYLLDCL